MHRSLALSTALWMLMLAGCGRAAAPGFDGATDAPQSSATPSAAATPRAAVTPGVADSSASPAEPALPVDPAFRISATGFLDVIERLATAPVETYDDAFRNRLLGASHSLEAMPKPEAEPMASIRRACGALQHDGAKLGVRVQLINDAEIADLRAMHKEDALEKQRKLKSDAALVREALMKGRPLKLTSDGHPFVEPETP